MSNSELLYWCREYARGRIGWQDYRAIRARVLRSITQEDEDCTVPVSQLGGADDLDTETTVSLGDEDHLNRKL